MLNPLELNILGPGASHRINVRPTVDEAIAIGSDPVCGVRVEGDAVSAIHAELFHDGEHWCVRDRASAGGTFIDDNRVFISAIRLEIGQRIRLGSGESAAILEVIGGAAPPQEPGSLVAEVAGYVKAQKIERRKLAKWKIALPSGGLLVIVAAWGIGALMVSRDRADRSAHPERYAAEDSNAAGERLAEIMAGEARPEDVDVNQILAAASLGRTSKLADAVIGTLKPGASRSSGSIRVEGIRTQAAQAPTSSGPRAQTIDEASVGALIASLDTGDASTRTATINRLVEESRILALRRVRSLLDQRAALQERGATPGSDRAKLEEIERRLASLGINAAGLNYTPGESLDALQAKLDVTVLENIRRRLIAALSEH